MLFKFLFRNLKGYRFLVVLVILVTVAQVASDIAVALPIKFITSKVSNPGSDPACNYPFLDGFLSNFDTPSLDRTLQPAQGQTQPKQPPTSPCPLSTAQSRFLFWTFTSPPVTHHSVIGVVIFSVLMLVAFGILSAILAYLDLLLATFIAQNLTARLRRQLFEHLQRLSLDWHGKQKKGDLVQRVTGNIADIEKLITDGLVDFLGAILILIGVALIMYQVSSSYTLLSLVIAPALFMTTFVYTKGIKAASKKAAKAAGQVANVATEDIGAITVLKAFTLEEREAIRFKRYVGKNRMAGLRAGGLQAQFTPLVSILIALSTATVIGVGGYVAAGNSFNIGSFTIAADSVDIGTLLLFLLYLKMLYQPMRDLSKLANIGSAASAGAERIQEVLDQAPEVVESTAPYNGPKKLRGDIAFENVTFGYTPTQPVLKGVNLRIPAGRKVALVGLSGGGKTTLVKLISRLYEIQQGAVRIDGVDNRLYPLAVLRQNVSLVLQDNVLFEGTIRENIEIGKSGATLEEIIDAAKKAYIHDTIMSFPGGYETEVREQGKNFSGGQRQRLAIARAILRDSPILILDEPTAALDVEAEAEVMHALDKLVVGRTVLMISHRLSTLGNVDEIIVLKEGVIAEQGSFQELKRKGGVFASLLEEQNRYNLDRAGDKSIIRSAFAPRLGAYQQSDVVASPPLAPYRPAATPPPVIPQPQYTPSPQPPAPAPIPPLPNNGGSPVAGQGYRGDGRRQEQGQPPVPVRNNPQQPPAPSKWLPMGTPLQQAEPYQKARVLIELDGKIISQYQLNKPVLTVGRLSANDVPVPSQRVSRLHAKIRWENGTWLIEDAESLNGLIYQGHRVERHVFNNGDRIHIAPAAVLQYEAIP